MTRRAVAAIVGTGYSKISRHSEFPLGALAVDAALAAAADAGIEPRQVDGLAVFPATAHLGAANLDGIDSVGLRYMASTLGLSRLRWCVTVAFASFIHSVIEAANAVAAGACEYALAWRAMHNPTGKFGRYEGARAEGDDQFRAPYGFADHISPFAFPYSRYLHQYGASADDMAAFVVTNRANATRNPDAVFYGKAITRDDYMQSPMVVEPMRLLDCDMPVDGCGAVIVTSLERANLAPNPPAYIVGSSSVVAAHADAAFHPLDRIQEAAGALAAAVWANSGLAPVDLDTANLYDGFSFFTYLWLEAFGFCPRGEASQFIQDGRIALDGALPLNTSGGSLGMGRLHGPPQVIESVRQLQGRCGERQVAGASRCLAVTGSPITPAALVLSADAG